MSIKEDIIREYGMKFGEIDITLVNFTLQRIEKLIEFIDVELMLTDVRDKQGNIVEFSSDVMGLIKVWWDMKSKKLLKEIKGDGA